MVDAMLAQFVEFVETGRWSNVRISIAIPGGIVAGEMISARQFLDELPEQTVIHRLEELTGEIGESVRSSAAGFAQEEPLTASPDYLYLREAVVLSATVSRGKQPRLGALRVRLEDVAAWSIGREEQE